LVNIVNVAVIKALLHALVCCRGVVQLFNAVKQQQGKIKEKVGEVKKSIAKTDKVRVFYSSFALLLSSLKI